MNENKLNNQRMEFNEEVNFLELFKILWKDKLVIFIFTLLATIIAITISLSIPDTFRSEASLAPAFSEGSSSNSSLGSLSGLASIAGGSLTNNNIDKTTMGIEVLKSRKFFNNLSKKYNLLIPLMASEGWDKESNSLIYNENIFDITNNKWVAAKEPSLQEAHKRFNENFIVSQNETGVINISIDHYSPNLAKDWLDSIIIEINNTSRANDTGQAERSINYLNEQIKTTQLSEIREMLNELAKSQIETVMLAKVTPEYLFKIIDPPYVPEDKVKPSRALICILGFLLGGLIGATFILIKHFLLNQKIKN